ncbi:MAG: sporulation transcription factor Spo0A [Symbiobacteriaceae bacterium]|nr:MAG: sporulation transcription factor Spo0A [Bacillota bacterium]
MAPDKIRLLICDDNREFCALLQEYFLLQPDMEVVGVAHDGLDGLAAIQEHWPDVVLLDIIMPYLDGIGVLEQLARIGLPRRPKILALSACCQESIARRVLAMGADYYVVKPVDLEMLGARVRQVASGSPLPAHPALRLSPAVPAAGHVLDEVHALLRSLGIPPHLKGYRYLGDAVLLVLQQPELLGAVTKDLYPAIARSNGTTASRVERAIRHAIGMAWDRGRDQLQRLVRRSGESAPAKPTNSEFIAAVADRLRARSAAG